MNTEQIEVTLDRERVEDIAREAMRSLIPAVEDGAWSEAARYAHVVIETTRALAGDSDAA